MMPASGPARPAESADTDGLPAAFAKDGAPYSLEELLSGLPPMAEDGALLLSELTAPAEPPPADWTAEAAPIPAPAPADEDAASAASAPIEDGPRAEDIAFAAPAAPPPEPTEPHDAAEPEWDPTTLALSTVAAALKALADDAPPDADDDVLVLGEADEYVEPAPEEETEAAPAGEPAPLPAPEPEPAQEAAPEPEHISATEATQPAELAARIEEIIAAHLPGDAVLVHKGDTVLPPRSDALALLLSDPPPDDDFAALDALYACWPRSTTDSPSRALLAVAQNLSRNFGLPGKLPMASAKAWRMLSAPLYEAELAQRLAEVGRFIAEWQKTQRTFLILEFSEVELIEYLFEALHPGYHAELLAEVMNFKVLSNRRMGLLRRVPGRMRKLIAPMLPDNKERALVELAHAKALLELVAANCGFAPIIDTAGKALEEIDKMMKAAANAGAPQLPPGVPPGALGRIG